MSIRTLAFLLVIAQVLLAIPAKDVLVADQHALGRAHQGV